MAPRRKKFLITIPTTVYDDYLVCADDAEHALDILRNSPNPEKFYYNTSDTDINFNLDINDVSIEELPPSFIPSPPSL